MTRPGDGDERRDAIGATIVDTLAESAPNPTRAVEPMRVEGMPDIEGIIEITGGTIF